MCHISIYQRPSEVWDFGGLTDGLVTAEADEGLEVALW